MPHQVKDPGAKGCLLRDHTPVRVPEQANPWRQQIRVVRGWAGAVGVAADRLWNWWLYSILKVVNAIEWFMLSKWGIFYYVDLT